MILSIPRTRFAATNSIRRQLWHIGTELVEVIRATLSGDLRHLAHELIDLITASVTLLYILADRYGIDVNRVQREVWEKNQKRGYHA